LDVPSAGRVTGTSHFVGTTQGSGKIVGIGKGARPSAMPAQERATNPAQFAELLNLFPCPAWIENFSGKILARNTHPIPTTSCRPLKTVAYPLPPAGNAKNLRLIALFPAKQKTDFQRHIISALLAKTLQPRQATVLDETLLTPRQHEIYRELTRDYPCKEIAAHLGISHINVLVQINRMRKTLGVDFLPYQRKKRRQLVN